MPANVQMRLRHYGLANQCGVALDGAAVIDKLLQDLELARTAIPPKAEIILDFMAPNGAAVERSLIIHGSEQDLADLQEWVARMREKIYG